MRIDYYEVQVNGKFLFNLNQKVSLSRLYFVKSNCFVLQIELSIYVGFCLLSKSISSRSSNRDASTSNFPSKAASSVVVHSWHKAGGKPAIVDNNSA